MSAARACRWRWATTPAGPDGRTPPSRPDGWATTSVERLLDRHGYRTAYWGHFGQGCVHCRLDFDLRSAPGVRNYRRFMEEAADLVVSHGGSLSGEHGDGQARGELLPRMFGPEIVEAFRAFKAIWDPAGRMNPGKVVDRTLDADLREGPDWRPVACAPTSIPGGRRSFVEAAGRASASEVPPPIDAHEVPELQVTREEKTHPGSRAPAPGDDGGRGDRSRTAGATTPSAGARPGPACKGCKGDGPVNVDMATQGRSSCRQLPAAAPAPQPYAMA